MLALLTKSTRAFQSNFHWISQGCASRSSQITP